MGLAESRWLASPVSLPCLASTLLSLFCVDGEDSQRYEAGTFSMSGSSFLQEELFSNYLRLASYLFCCLSGAKGCMPISNAAIWFALPWKCQPGRLWGHSCLLPKHSLCLWRQERTNVTVCMLVPRHDQAGHLGLLYPVWLWTGSILDTPVEQLCTAFGWCKG